MSLINWNIMTDIITSGKGYIKLDSIVSQDRRYNLKWPQCLPPQQEYKDEEYKYVCKDVYKIFDVVWDGQKWKCKVDGYGCLETGNYGNGSISVYKYDDIVIVSS